VADVKERFDDLTEVIRVGNERSQSRIWTALPVVVTEDSDGFTVKAQPTIKAKDTDITGQTTDKEIPPLPDIPVQFSSGGGFTITHPIKKGDEGIVIFSARCIDGWWEKGGTQPQIRQRWHNLSDGMYIPGIRSKPRKLGGADTGQEHDYAARGVSTSPKGEPCSTTSVQIRTDDGKYFIELAPEGVVNIVCKTLNVKAEDKVLVETKEVTVKASDKTRFETPKLEVTGDVAIDGHLKVGGQVTGKVGGVNITLTDHRHIGVRGGPDQSGPPATDT
jgi:phage baseplate assembly protein gpV